MDVAEPLPSEKMTMKQQRSEQVSAFHAGLDVSHLSRGRICELNTEHALVFQYSIQFFLWVGDSQLTKGGVISILCYGWRLRFRVIVHNL